MSSEESIQLSVTIEETSVNPVKWPGGQNGKVMQILARITKKGLITRFVFHLYRESLMTPVE